MERILSYLGGVGEDYKRYKMLRGIGFWKLCVCFPEFRYQVLYRVRRHSRIMRILLRPLSLFNSLNLYINCTDIGGGLFIEHGFSTIISCKHIGRNCRINQQITIGYADKDNSPYIGDDVQIKAGAKVIGNVTISDDVIIGAGAVVVNNVPSHCIVVGVPAKIIKRRDSLHGEWKRC